MTPDKSVFKEWLEKLQQESWQLELLISGFAIFGIYSARVVITDFSFFVENEFFDEMGTALGLLVFVCKTGWLIFFFNLLVHVILRGLWIGAIGLRYVSQEIDYDSFNYSEKFTRFLKVEVGSYDDFIERLEKICSVLFAFTFLLFLLFLSFMIFVFQALAIIIVGVEFTKQYAELSLLFSFLSTLYSLLGFLVFIDLITLGGFKKIKENKVSTIYFYVYRFFSAATLSFLYRPLLYNFIDNSYTKKLFYLSIPYIFIVIGGYTMFENNANPYVPPRDNMIANGVLLDDYYYDDLRQKLLEEYSNDDRKNNKQHLKWISLEQFEITKSWSSLFINIDGKLIEMLEKDSTINPYKKPGISFKWFGLSNKKDDKLVQLRENRKQALKPIFEQRRTLSKQLKKQFNNETKSKIDSINKIIETKIAFWNHQETKMEKDKIDQIISGFLSHTKFYVDSIPLNLEKCYFYTHPHFKEKGLRCFFNTDSLTNGLHQIKLSRNFIFNDDIKISTDSLILPIIINH